MFHENFAKSADTYHLALVFKEDCISLFICELYHIFRSSFFIENSYTISYQLLLMALNSACLLSNKQHRKLLNINLSCLLLDLQTLKSPLMFLNIYIYIYIYINSAVYNYNIIIWENTNKNNEFPNYFRL